jgi:hypothetical protein
MQGGYIEVGCLALALWALCHISSSRLTLLPLGPLEQVEPAQPQLMAPRLLPAVSGTDRVRGWWQRGHRSALAGPVPKRQPLCGLSGCLE